MKIQFLEQIIARIQHEIHCPKCKNSFKKEHVEVNSVQGNQIEFSTRCHICGAESQISANIGVIPANKSVGLESAPKAVISSEEMLRDVKPQNAEKKLGFDAVKDVLDDLSAFKGKDVRDLFGDSDK